MHLLWLLMEFDIHRYLIVNTRGRLDGYEKAMRHINLCAIFVASMKYCSIDRAKSYDEWKKVHDATQKLTDYMDKEIGFPIDSSDEADYDKLALKFFNRFIELAEKCIDK